MIEPLAGYLYLEGMPPTSPHAKAPSWRNWVFLGAALVVFVAVPLDGQLGGAGRIEGTARYGADFLPGTRVTVANADFTRSVITSADGRFVFPSLPQGRYTVTAELAGFQTEQQAGVHVTSGQTTTVDLALQVGCLAEVLYTNGPGLQDFLKDADVIVHLRIATAGPIQRFAFGNGCLVGAVYEATPIRVLTDATKDVSSSNRMRFVQEGDGPLYAYAAGQEYVAFLRWEPTLKTLRPVAGSRSMLPVHNGRVEWPRTDVPELTDGMSVADFLAALNPKLPAARPK